MTAETKITEHSYADGKVVWIQDNLGKDYAAHTWVLRPGGYRLLQSTKSARVSLRHPVTGRSTTSLATIPCNMVPYKPISASEKASLDAWQDQEGKNGPGPSRHAHGEKRRRDQPDHHDAPTLGDSTWSNTGESAPAGYIPR